MQLTDGYSVRVLNTPFSPDLDRYADFSLQWNLLLPGGASANPFLRFEYLAALHHSGSATPATGWSPHAITLWQGRQLCAACMVYVKTHSYGEYVFDHAWANAYAQHGLAYYPKALVAVPFTPVPGPRLLAVDKPARQALVRATVEWCEQKGLSSLHLLFTDEDSTEACDNAELMLRHTVQFHWTNDNFENFDAFLASLNQEKRKKIRQERRKVAEAGVVFRSSQGPHISAADWDFFYRCYERTYLEHGNAPYLTRDFFARLATTAPENWLLFTAERDGRPIAASLIAIGQPNTSARASIDAESVARVAYGRYWGALERVDCLHFEACYYQPLAWCIAQGYHRFEGGAQGEHKMARALLPVKTYSAHWLAHPAFADAVQNFLEREGQGIENYLTSLEQRSPLRATS